MSDHDILQRVRDGALNIAELCTATGLGSSCGKCVPYAQQALAQGAASGQPVAAAAAVRRADNLRHASC